MAPESSTTRRQAYVSKQANFWGCGAGDGTRGEFIKTPRIIPNWAGTFAGLTLPASSAEDINFLFCLVSTSPICPRLPIQLGHR